MARRALVVFAVLVGGTALVAVAVVATRYAVDLSVHGGDNRLSSVASTDPVASPLTRPASAAAVEEALSLLAKRDLHPLAPTPSASEVTLAAGSQMLEGLASTSQEVGLELDDYAGRRVELDSYVLRERSRSKQGTVTAIFVVSGDKVVGVALSFAGYYGDLFSLDERDQFQP